MENSSTSVQALNATTIAIFLGFVAGRWRLPGGPRQHEVEGGLLRRWPIHFRLAERSGVGRRFYGCGYIAGNGRLDHAARLSTASPLQSAPFLDGRFWYS